MADANIVIEAQGLQKTYRDFWGRPKAKAVAGIDFTIRQGEVIGFLGPNGSGKSTTIKMILGLLYPSSGRLRVMDRNPSNVEIKKRIGYLPEETYLYKYLTAEETLDFFGSLFNLPKSVRKKRTKELLDMVGLSHAAHRPVGEFSKGMARRIGLAQALINNPDLIILDEPTSGLDPIGTKQVKDVIRLLAENKKTVILCSHLLGDVEDVCDTVMIMYGGVIRARGGLKELLEVQERTRIDAPALSKQQLERIITILNEAGGASDVKVGTPTRNLEEFFMEVVNQARRETKEISGATNEGAIAAYLVGDAAKAAGQQRLEELVRPEQHQETLDAIAAEKVKSAEPVPDVAKLSHLNEETPVVPAATDADNAPAPKKAVISEDEKAAKNKAIQDLLKKKK